MTSLLRDLDQSSPATSSASPPAVRPGSRGGCCGDGVGGLGWAGWTVYESTARAPRPKSASDIARQDGRARGHRREVHAGGQATSPGSEQRVSAVAPPPAPNFRSRRPMRSSLRSQNAEQANAVSYRSAPPWAKGLQSGGLTPNTSQTSEQLNDAVKIFPRTLADGRGSKDVPAFLVANGA